MTYQYISSSSVLYIGLMAENINSKRCLLYRLLTDAQCHRIIALIIRKGNDLHQHNISN